MARSSRLGDRLRWIEQAAGLAQCALNWRVRSTWTTLAVLTAALLCVVRPAALPESVKSARAGTSAAVNWAALLNFPSADDPRFYKPDRLAELYLAALAERDTNLLERLTSGRLAQHTPDEWAALATKLSTTCGLPRATAADTAATTSGEYTAIRHVGTADASRALVLIMRECPTTCYSVVAVSEAPPDTPLDALLERGVAWFTHELDAATPENWIELPELTP